MLVFLHSICAFHAKFAFQRLNLSANQTYLRNLVADVCRNLLIPSQLFALHFQVVPMLNLCNRIWLKKEKKNSTKMPSTLLRRCKASCVHWYRCCVPYNDHHLDYQQNMKRNIIRFLHSIHLHPLHALSFAQFYFISGAARIDNTLKNENRLLHLFYALIYTYMQICCWRISDERIFWRAWIGHESTRVHIFRCDFFVPIALECWQRLWFECHRIHG